MRPSSVAGNRLVLLSTLTLGLFVWTGSSLAQQATQTVTVTMGRALPFEFSGGFERLAVGDPSRISLTLLPGNSVLITGKRPGLTNVIAWLNDGSRDEIDVMIEPDLSALRQRLRAVDPSITVGMTNAGDRMMLTGVVEGPAEANMALELAGQFLGGTDASRPTAMLTSDQAAGAEQQGAGSSSAAGSATAPSTGQSALNAALAKLTGQQVGGSTQAQPVSGNAPTQATSVKNVINLLRYRTLPKPLEERLGEVLQDMAPGVNISRMQAGPIASDATDKFILRGRIATQPLYWRMLSMLDQQLGGVGTGFSVIANIDGSPAGGASGGGNAASSLSSTGGSSSSSGGGGIQLAQGLAVTNTNGRLLSYVQVDEIPMVIVAVRILEIDRTYLREIGLDGSQLYTSYHHTNELLGGAIPGDPDSANGIPNNGDIYQALNIIGGRAAGRFGVVHQLFQFESAFRLLQTEGIARSLAEPNLVAISGEEASFQVGDTVGIEQTTTDNGVSTTSTQTLELGVKLTVKPVVGEDGTIVIDLSPEVTGSFGAQEGGQFKFSTKNLESRVRLRQGEGLVIGGLIEKTSDQSVSKTPFLSAIPLLGELFTSRSNTTREHEVAFAVFPRIARPSDALMFQAELPEIDRTIRVGELLDGGMGILRKRKRGAGVGQTDVELPMLEEEKREGREVDADLPMDKKATEPSAPDKKQVPPAGTLRIG